MAIVCERMQETATGDWINHAQGHSGDDRTLCGLAYEGDDGFSSANPVHNAYITCATCQSIIRYCKRISVKDFR